MKHIHFLKKKYGYKFQPNDLKFETVAKILRMGAACMLAAVLCGSTGIAGGMVLGPLMLAYNMLPQVMSGTNQFITMIASTSTVLQYVMLNDLLYGYALLYGCITVLAAFGGLKAINVYLARSGR